MNPEIVDMSRRLVDIDFRAFIRQDVGIWDPRPDHAVESADELVEAMTARVPREHAIRLLEELEAGIAEEGGSLEPFLRELDLPLLLVRHAGCIVFTPHGFDDAVAAFPDAHTLATHASPCFSSDFGDALRNFAESL